MDVEHRTADDDRHRAAGRDRLDIRGGGLLIAGDGRGLGDVQHVELMVRDAAARFDGQLGGADVHTAVELHRIGVHNFGATGAAGKLDPFCKVERQLRLAGARRADDRQRPHGCQTPAKYPTP